MNEELLTLEAALKEQQALYGGLTMDLKSITERLPEIEKDCKRINSRIIQLKSQQNRVLPPKKTGKKKMPITEKILKDAKPLKVVPPKAKDKK
jgi:hypothetical protein